MLLGLAWVSAAPPPGLVSDGPRWVLDLGGTWEACPAELALVFPPPAEGWQPQVVPHPETALLDSNGIGPYFPDLSKVIAADGRSPARSDRQAAWFRRSFSVPGGAPSGTRALLRCHGIAWRSVLWLNGSRIGGSDLGMAPNTYDITATLRAEANDLVIGVAGRAALWDSEHRSFTAPIAGVMPGIWDSVRLEIVPALRLEDIFVKTTVATPRLEVELTLTNAGSTAATAAAVVTVNDPDGVPRLTLATAPVTLAAGETRTVVSGADWVAPLLWSPGAPNLHRAVAELRQGEATTDRLEATFGFREFSAAGRDFRLNGRRQVLLRNSWLTGPGTPRERVLPQVRDEITQFNCIRQHLQFINPHTLAAADAVGLMVIPEFWGFYQNSNVPFPITQADVWVANTAETMRRLVRRHRNHPSVIMWSMTNETFWDSTSPEHMAVADVLAKTVRAADPTRLLQGDGEITWGGRLDAIGIHYPEGDAGTVSKTYTNSGWIVPNDLAWLKQDGTNHSWRADFTWDRPLMLGEYYCQDGDEPERYTPYAGDEAYDATKWRWQALNGCDALMPRPDNGWIRMVKMSTDHYRAAGVACLNPWTGSGRQLLPFLLVAPLDYFPNAFGGEDFPRRFIVANDHTTAYNDLHVQAGLLVDGREVWSERRIPCYLEPGESKELTIVIQPPAVLAQVRARLVVRLCWMRGPTPAELCRHEEDLWISPRASLAGVTAAAVALADRPDGATTKALAALGLELTPGPCDDAALGDRRVLIIGEGAAASADLAAAARFAERGGRVLVLHQTALDLFVPGQPDIDPKHAASFSWRQAAHPALAGLADEQLRFWRPDHLVVSETLVRPAAGPAASVAACGGRYGMHWSPLAELRHGKGAVTFCQYLLADRVTVEPAAGRILTQAVQAALAAAPLELAPALRLAAGVSPAARAVLATCSVLTRDGLDGAGPVLLDASTPPDAAELPRLRAEIEAGGIVWLRGLDEKTLPAVAALLPWTPGFAPLPPGTLGAVRRGDHAFAAGLGSSDLYWARGGKTTAALGGPVLSTPTLQAAVVLTEPALLVAVPVGQGWVLVDQFAWDQALSAETERVTRLVSCLARNLGAGFSIAPSKRYRFTHLDLAKVANRAYADATAGDGSGGWTDQGDNDMRYFLINHTGMVGGMAVAAAAFPAEVSFAGVSFGLLDPATHDGKGVLTLRGGPHGPECPSEARGIPAGNAQAERLWFLHAGCWGSDGGYGVEVARYEVVYADGSRAAIPVRQGQEIADWWNPAPLAGAQVAWTGRNEKTAPIGIYSMPWDNPHPDQPIAAIDVVGNLAQTQVVLLAITLGSEASGGARTVAAWDCGRFVAGAIPAATGEVPLTGSGSPVTAGGRAGLRLTGGQALQARLASGPLADGTPVAVEIEVAPDGAPGGYYGGLVECGAYLNAGFRMMLNQQLRVVVEHFAGEGKEKATYLTSREALAPGRFATVRYEHDGRQARLLIDGLPQEVKECSLPAPWQGDLRVGVAGGKDYFLNGVVGNVRILALPAPPPPAGRP
jgi:beta-galactosidase